MSIALLAVVMVTYLSLLFWLASRGDKLQFIKHSWTRHPLIYALALGVYCTSWTFYGLVGTAATKTWSFAPILIGPMLLFIFGQPLLRRVALLCRQENIRSIADFLASRYGKRRGIATSVTLIVFVATVPYIALQIKAVTDTFLLVANTERFSAEEMGLITSVAMITFAQLFGIKRLDVSGYHAGLMSVIALESLVKLFALLVVAAFALTIIFTEFPEQHINTIVENYLHIDLSLRFWVETGVSAAAILCLPRMFHVTFVENLSNRHLSVARFVFPAYLILIGLCIVVIAIAGNAHFSYGAINTTPADTYVLALPLSYQYHWLTLLGFIGGFSAATAMIIVATVTLSHMLGNDVILPLIIHRHQRHANTNSVPANYSRGLMLARRITVALVVALAYVYQRALAGNAALTDIGLIAFALVVQLFPALIFGIYFHRGNAYAAYAGLAAGCSLWFVTLMLPLLVQAGAVATVLVDSGFAGINWLRPEYLFGLEFADPFTRGVVISLAANTLFYWLFSLAGKLQLADRIQARAFVDRSRALPSIDTQQTKLQLNDLRVLLTQFLGESATAKLIARHHDFDAGQEVNSSLFDAAEHALAGIVGVASSIAMLTSVSTGKHLAVEDVVNMFEETTKALRFNQNMVVASFETISSAISVVNADLKLVSWNRRYEEMFDYPAGMLKVGVPVDELVRFNSSRGLLGPGAANEHVQRRLTHLRLGQPYRVVRGHGSSVIEIKGSPLPGGGYVTTYDDISEFIDAQEKLEKSNLYLEQRVKERTAELEIAQKAAEEANRGKSRFLALASHDILQPLNAASLYAGVLLENAKDSDPENCETILHLRAAIQSTESIISTLMEIAKLDTSVLTTEIKTVSLNTLLESLINEYQVQLRNTVELRYVATQLHIKTDQRYIRRILQNLLSNAVKFTRQGKILVGCRRRGDQVEIFVCDTGPGVHPDELEQIFTDFYRSASQHDVEGLGLGLAVAARFSRLLQHRIQCKSILGRGSCFSVVAPLAIRQDDSSNDSLEELPPPSSALQGRKVVYIDDDAANIHAMETLLSNWGCHMYGYTITADILCEAEQQPDNCPDLLLVDLQLDHQNNGIKIAKLLQEIWQHRVPTCIVSASQDPNLAALVATHHFEFLRKPLKPGKLRAVLEQLLKRAGKNDAPPPS